MTQIIEAPTINTVPEFPTIVLEHKPTEVVSPPKPKIKRAPKHDFKDGRGRVFAHRHDNGRGWVEDTAHVGADVYVGPTAQVMNNATILGKGIRIEAKAVVKGWATVLTNTRLGGFAVVSGKSVVRETTMFNECAVTGNAEISNCFMEGAVSISGSAYAKGCRFMGRILLGDNAAVISTHARGFVQFMGNSICARSNFEGIAEVRESAQVLRARVRNGQYQVCYLPWHEFKQKTLRPEFFVTITGNAVVQNDSEINTPMIINNRSLLTACEFIFDQPSVNFQYLFTAPNEPNPNTPIFTRKTVSDKKWCNARVHDYGAFERLLASDDQPAANGMRTIRPEDVQSPYSLERLPSGRRIVPV